MAGHLFRCGALEASRAPSVPLVKIFVFVLARPFHIASALYPLDCRGGHFFFFLALFFAAPFTALLLHFSPLATFDALGPSFLSPLCALFSLFFFHLCHFPSEPPTPHPPSPSFCLPMLQLFFPPLGLWMWRLHGKRFHPSYPRPHPPSPHPTPLRICSSCPTAPRHDHFSPSLRLFDVSAAKVGLLRKSRRRSPGGFDCSGGLCMGSEDGPDQRWDGHPPLTPPRTSAPLSRTIGLDSLWPPPGWLRPRRLSFPSPFPINSCSPFVFQA